MLTQLLDAAGSGDRPAFDRLYKGVYAELRRMAQASMRREGSGHTLQPTALVNEAYLRLRPESSVGEPRAFLRRGGARRCGASWSTTRGSSSPTSAAAEWSA